jgi:hypothetical protein
MEAAGDAELRFSQFAEIVRAAERRLSDLEDGQVLPSGDHPAASDSAGSVRAASDIKKRKGWPDCLHCELWRPISQQCGSVNENGLSPCEVMSRKMYKYLRRED